MIMENADTTYQLYRDIIGIHSPWEVTDVVKDESTRKITVRIEHDGETMTPCPICGQPSTLHDHRKRVLRYLDTCQYETFLEADVPRVRCSKDGVHQMDIPFAEKHSRWLLSEVGSSPLTKTRFDWLVNSNIADNRSWKRRDFMSLSKLHLKTSKAWRTKETANIMWDYCYMTVAENAWKKLLAWISRCRIPEMIKVGKTVKKYLWGIMNAIRLKVTNSMVEAKNARIQQIKRAACGFRNRERFRVAILFHLGNLDMGFSTK